MIFITFDFVLMFLELGNPQNQSHVYTFAPVLSYTRILLVEADCG